jgi:hypothetical protein
MPDSEFNVPDALRADNLGNRQNTHRVFSGYAQPTWKLTDSTIVQIDITRPYPFRSVSVHL